MIASSNQAAAKMSEMARCGGEPGVDCEEAKEETLNLRGRGEVASGNGDKYHSLWTKPVKLVVNFCTQSDQYDSCRGINMKLHREQFSTVTCATCASASTSLSCNKSSTFAGVDKVFPKTI